jgi:hypothetical protein
MQLYEQQLTSHSPDRPKWPSGLRIRNVEDAAGIWEVTWSFSGPAGRATFEYIQIDGKLALRWRRIGGHEIFKSP